MPQEWETGMVINTQKRNKKQMWKLHYFIVHSQQTIHKHNKKNRLMDMWQKKKQETRNIK